MAEDQLRTVIDALRTRLQAELGAQLDAVSASHEQSLAAVRRAADAEAEKRLAAKIEATQAEWTARVQSEVAAARSEVERTMVAEAMRMRVEAEQAAAEAASKARREMEQALAAERKRAESELAAERERAESELEAERARAHAQIEAERHTAQAQVDAERQRVKSELSQSRVERELAQARAAFEAERDLEARRTAAPARTTSGLLDAVRGIDAAASLSDALAAAVRGAAQEAPRTALFIVSGTELREWPVPGVPTVRAGLIRADGPEAGVLGEVVRRHEPMATGCNGGPAAPAFASLPPGRAALAVPFVLGGQPVAVLYADEGVEGEAPPGWQETVQVLGRHASACVAYLTAVRTAQAMQLMSGAPGTGAGAVRAGIEGVPASEPGRDSEQDEAQGARRYARLLVSEIKLYNENQVRMGRERRDLMQRLKPEIDRARRLYDERIAPSIRSRDVYFQQELVQTLAGGDQSLLG
jgi:chemotaxis protein histidine kinase CheA